MAGNVPSGRYKFPVRVAQVVGKAVNGGVESFILNRYQYIDREKIQYDCIIDEDSTCVPFQEKIKSLGGRIFVVPPHEKLFANMKALYKIFTENKYPLVYSHLNTMSVFPLFTAWRAGIPIRVAHSHSTAGKGRGEYKRDLLKYILRPFAKIFPTDLCASSVFAGEWMFGKKTMQAGKVNVWSTAIDIERFVYNERKREEMRGRLNLGGKFVVGHAGRFVSQKNHDFLLDIFAEIHRLRGDSVLLLVGDGPLLEEFTEKVRALGLESSVIFAGSVNDIENYYQAMDVFILPSFYEGMPAVGSEVQVSGLPFLCSDRVTPETKFCDNLEFMSLNHSAGEWAREALRISEGHIRRDMRDIARNAGFDVRTQAAKMSKWYCDLLGI